MIINTYLGQQLCAIFLFVTFCGVLFSQEEEVRILPGQEHIEYNTAGAAKFQTGEYDAAIQDFKKSLEYKPDYATARFNLALAYFNLKMYKDAKESFALLQKSDPEILESSYYAPFCSFYLGDYESAKMELERAINQFPEKTELYDHLARIYIKEDEIGKEEQVYNRLLAVDPNNIKALFHRALINSEMQEFNDALADYTRVLNLDPKHTMAYANRGVILINLGKIEDGCADLKKAKELGDNSPAVKELIPVHCQ
ncbi:MAG: tetratricopeptide repeat protein [Flavobacteriales bacterium]|nr:tetratricopeptide repeat protein [Flavobacteriales bacterium]